MDAVQFIKGQKRMCKNYAMQNCHGCPLNGVTGCNYSQFMNDKEENIVSIVEKWIKEHPAKTLLQDLLEKYPDVKLKSYVPGGTSNPCFCARALGYKIPECDGSKNCAECWDSPLEETK